jgi:hypothetical protein
MEYPEISPSAAAKVRLKAPIYSAASPDQIRELKEAAARFITLVEQIDADKPASERTTAREAALAITHIQTASMFAVFAATMP